jgi:hypothetical protein
MSQTGSSSPISPFDTGGKHGIVEVVLKRIADAPGATGDLAKIRTGKGV